MINNPDLQVEIKFLTPEEEYFTGTVPEIVAELYRRSMLYGNCAYMIEPKVAFLFDMEE